MIRQVNDVEMAREQMFNERLVQHSEAKELNAARKEWTPYAFYTEEDGEPCPCGYQYRTSTVILLNHVNGAKLDGGMCCMHRLPDLNGKKLIDAYLHAQLVLELTLPPEALQLCLEEKLIDEKQLRIYRDILSVGVQRLHKRILSPKQVGFVRFVNYRFLKLIRSRIPEGRNITLPSFINPFPQRTRWERFRY